MKLKNKPSYNEIDSRKQKKDDNSADTDKRSVAVKEKAINPKNIYKTPKELAIIEKEYHDNVNENIVSYVNDVLNGKTNSEFKLTDITPREIEDIKKITGIDVTGFTRVLTPNCIKHINNRHGKTGESDQSMSDIKDIARIEYVLKNYDDIRYAGIDEQYRNFDNAPAKKLLYTKRINGYYYVAETIPDSRKKQLIVKSAYKF